jgi:YVTN family beta-propeller protein
VDDRTGLALVLSRGIRPGHIYVLDTRRGDVVRSIPAAGPYAVAVSEPSGRVYVADALAGSVMMLDARSGAVLRTIPLTTAPYAAAYSPNAMTIDGRTGRVFISGMGSTTLTVLDAKNGSVQDIIPLEYSPSAVAVDGQGKRAFVINRGMWRGKAASASWTLRTEWCSVPFPWERYLMRWLSMSGTCAFMWSTGEARRTDPASGLACRSGCRTRHPGFRNHRRHDSARAA